MTQIHFVPMGRTIIRATDFNIIDYNDTSPPTNINECGYWVLYDHFGVSKNDVLTHVSTI